MANVQNNFNLKKKSEAISKQLLWQFQSPIIHQSRFDKQLLVILDGVMVAKALVKISLIKRDILVVEECQSLISKILVVITWISHNVRYVANSVILYLIVTINLITITKLLSPIPPLTSLTSQLRLYLVMLCGR